VGRGEFLGVSHAPTARGGPPRSSIFGVPFYLCVHPSAQNYQIWRGNTYEDGLVFYGVSYAPPEGSGDPTLPNFGVLLCLWLHPLKQNDQCVMTTDMGACFRWSARPFISMRRGPSSQCGVALADPILRVLRYLCVHGLT